MIFSGQLGTNNSQFGNLELGVSGLTVNSAAGSSTLTLTGTATRAATFVRSASDTLVFTQGISNAGLSPTSETITFTGTATRAATFGRIGSTTITFTGAATRSGIFVRAASDTLSFSGVATGVRSFEADASNTITFSGSVDAQRVLIRESNNTLAFTQAATKALTLIRSASNELIFNQLNNRHIPLAGYSILTPQATYVLKPRKCIVILESPQQVIVLPCPLFNDAESNQTSVLIKRSMNNRLYSFIRTNDLQKLRYQFRVERLKSLELKQFVQTNIGSVIKLTNWKGEQWLVNFTNNPIELSPKARSSPTREKVEVSLEFQGIKIAG